MFARRVEMSRALLYMHLARLEEAGFVRGELELGADGKALKFFEVLPFTLTIDKETLVSAVRADVSTTTKSTTQTTKTTESENG